MFGKNAEDLTSAVKLLKSSFTDVTHSVEESCVSAFHSSKFDEFLIEIKIKFKDQLCVVVERESKCVFLSLK